MEKRSGTQVICPHCGYRMPEVYLKTANSNGVFVRCKNKKSCGKEFEIKIENGKQNN